MTQSTRLRELAISESGFVFDPHTGHAFTVNATGLVLLRILHSGCGLDQAAEKLRDAFDVVDEDVSRDVDEFVARLREHGLVR